MTILQFAASNGVPTAALSGIRGQLASYDNAYRVALNLTQETAEDHLVIATGTDFQPHAVIRSSDILPGSRIHDIVRLGWIVAHVQTAA